MKQKLVLVEGQPAGRGLDGCFPGWKSGKEERPNLSLFKERESLKIECLLKFEALGKH